MFLRLPSTLAVLFTCLLAVSLGAFELRDLEGKIHRPFENKDTKAVVFIFVLTDCPIANQYQPKIAQLHKHYDAKGIRFFVVQSDPSTTVEEAQKHRQDYAIKCPVVLDPKHQWIQRLGATVTPEAAVVDRDETLLYRGRIDDRFPNLGQKRFHVTSNDLEDALEAIVHGQPVKSARTKAIGCYIPPLKSP